MAENERVTITSQPEDCFCTVGDRCSFSVAAQGNGLTYQWQYSANNGTTWTDSLNVTAVTPTMTIGAAKASQIGLLWRCIITDGEGRTAVSQTGTAVDSAVTRPITITNQPDDVCCSEGGSVAFSVEAVGNGLTYHWQISTDGSDWSNIYSQTAFTPTYAWNGVHPSSFGNYYRCKITDAEGNVAYSRPARLKRDTTLWEFTYNADGLRTGRTNGESTYAYTYLGTQLTHMTVDGHTLYFTYDAAGTPVSVSCDGDFYYYVTNIQGDVIAIIDTVGTQVVSYAYDAWGNILSHTGSTSTIGRYNPLTYRGYVYDADTGLYYLQSRYYNPETGRFINADGYVATGQGFVGNNMFAYCLNNPVNMVDIQGRMPEWISRTKGKVEQTEAGSYYADIGFGRPHLAKTKPGKLPTTGAPNSSQVLYNPDGSIKQKRWYGPDGKAERDRDYNHPGDMDFPHDHEWEDSDRGTDHLPPSSEYQFSTKPLAGLGLITICGISIIAVAAEDGSGVGVINDFLIVVLLAGIKEGARMIGGSL